MLTVKVRQVYLKELGYYTGKIDGIEGKLTKAAYLKMQKEYFTRKADCDGVYGTDTERLLVNAYRVHTHTKNFKLEEFKCECGGKYCTGYPVKLNAQLLKNLQKVRTKFGTTTITSGMRCKPYNNSLVGSSATSRHMDGKALDIYNETTRTEAGRKIVMQYVKKLTGHNYTYCNIGGSVPNMGNAVHFDVK